MPELPEVETIVRTLEKSLLGETINTAELYYEPLCEAQSQYTVKDLIGSRFTKFERRGKYLLFTFSNGLSMILHLRMEGKFHLYDSHYPISKHTHMLLRTMNHDIHYLDTRKFSRFAIVDNPQEYLEKKNLGLEPWDDGLDANYLFSKYQKTQRPIKSVLLDQSIITGIGNIYADEILYTMKIHPLTSARRITKKQCKELIPIVRETLEKAIQAGGTTIRSYTSQLNVSGRFQVELNAYGRSGQECKRCNTILEHVKISGRTSVYCPKCQKVKL